jgi:hypothetical protein
MKALFLPLFSGLKWGKLATGGGSMLLALPPEPDAFDRRDPRRPAAREGVAVRSQGA